MHPRVDPVEIALELGPEPIGAGGVADPRAQPGAIGPLAKAEVVPHQAAAEEQADLGARAEPRTEAPESAPVARG